MECILTTNLLAPINRLIIKEIEQDRKTSGGIILTDKAGDPESLARKGVVVHSGEDESGKMLLPVGTELYFGKFTGINIQVETEKYVSILKTEIVAVVGE